jgi:hypothetical protein
VWGSAGAWAYPVRGKYENALSKALAEKALAFSDPVGLSDDKERS